MNHIRNLQSKAEFEKYPAIIHEALSDVSPKVMMKMFNGTIQSAIPIAILRFF